MACEPSVRTIQLGKKLIFTMGGTAPAGNDFVMTGSDIEQIATLLDQVRVTAELENSTPGLQYSVYYELSSDGGTWTSRTNLLTDMSGDTTVTSSWSTNSNWMRAIRIGVTVEQNAVTTREMAFER